MSADFPVGIPFNIASYALLLWIVAQMTGYTASTFTHFVADAHIYLNQIDGVLEQLEREPQPLPRLVYTGPNLYELFEDKGPEVFEYITTNMFTVDDYNPHRPIKYAFNV